jgi:hypothetical protein
MAIKGTLSRVATIGGSIVGAGNIRAKQVAIGTTAGTDISSKSLQELADVNATETDDGILSYNASTDKWETTTTLDGGTF